MNNGHTIQVNPDHQNHLRLGLDKFDLLQFHFHHPSEHVIPLGYAIISELKTSDSYITAVSTGLIIIPPSTLTYV